jgi:nucleotide-binding universal stress UspA family protein
MRNLLVPVVNHDLMTSVLRTTILVAQRFGSYVEGFALRPALAEYVPVDVVGGLTWITSEETDEVDIATAQAEFERAMSQNGVAQGSGPEKKPAYGWLATAAPGDAFLGQHARLFDATVLGRPGVGAMQPRTLTLEAALFESGRPILIAPPEPPASLGETVVIAWNGSTETARAIAFGMPFLRTARRVVVVAVDNGMVAGPTGDQVAGALARDGIAAESTFVAAGRRSAGEVFLATASSVGCDLLIKGAYTQSRLRQMIFGGATSHILAHATIPVLMAH